MKGVTYIKTKYYWAVIIKYFISWTDPVLKRITKTQLESYLLIKDSHSSINFTETKSCPALHFTSENSRKLAQQV